MSERFTTIEITVRGDDDDVSDFEFALDSPAARLAKKHKVSIDTFNEDFTPDANDPIHRED